MRSMASSASSRGVVAIVGVGPNLGRCIARKFAHEGYTVAILSRDLGMHSSPLSCLRLVGEKSIALAKHEKPFYFSNKLNPGQTKRRR